MNSYQDMGRKRIVNKANLVERVERLESSRSRFVHRQLPISTPNQPVLPFLPFSIAPPDSHFTRFQYPSGRVKQELWPQLLKKSQATVTLSEEILKLGVARDAGETPSPAIAVIAAVVGSDADGVSHDGGGRDGHNNPRYLRRHLR